MFSLLLSSRSIVQINASLSFQPHSINVIQKTCQRGGRESACLNATACFTTLSRSPGPQSNSFGITNSHILLMNGWKEKQPTLTICPPSSSDLWVFATLDDRKLSARALFDDSSHRQTQLAVRVHTGRTVCYRMPFHVYVSLGGRRGQTP